jgi:hypothetical protein
MKALSMLLGLAVLCLAGLVALPTPATAARIHQELQGVPEGEHQAGASANGLASAGSSRNTCCCMPCSSNAWTCVACSWNTLPSAGGRFECVARAFPNAHGVELMAVRPAALQLPIPQAPSTCAAC